MDLNGKHVIITGATAGIGRSSALTLAGLGADLTLLSRNPGKAEALALEISGRGGRQPTPYHHGHGPTPERTPGSPGMPRTAQADPHSAE